MAHECPVCGLTCRCGGDIGDCCFGETEDLVCTHCPEDRDADGPEDEDDARRIERLQQDGHSYGCAVGQVLGGLGDMPLNSDW